MRHTEQRPQVKVIGLSIRVQVTMVTNNNSNYEHNNQCTKGNDDNNS